MARKQKLTPKQEAFVREYLIDLNATQAAIRAGYSPKTARVVGSENLTKPDIERAIAEAQGAREKRLDISADHVLEELARIAFADTTSAIRVEDGRVVVQDTDEMDENTRRAISEISETVTTNGGTLKVKFHDKVKALELLGKHLGIFKDDKQQVNVSVSLGLADIQREASRRQADDTG